jgi:hypothetical protein
MLKSNSTSVASLNAAYMIRVIYRASHWTGSDAVLEQTEQNTMKNVSIRPGWSDKTPPPPLSVVIGWYRMGPSGLHIDPGAAIDTMLRIDTVRPSLRCHPVPEQGDSAN